MADPTEPDAAPQLGPTASGSRAPGGQRPVTAPHLEINEVRDGLIVYDTTRDRVHYLNATASVVFTLCDGQHSPEAMAAELATLFEVDPPHPEVADCLANFAAEGLLQ
jgi:hypothetical protein